MKQVKEPILCSVNTVLEGVQGPFFVNFKTGTASALIPGIPLDFFAPLRLQSKPRLFSIPTNLFGCCRRTAARLGAL
jgi:hypothetical protein